MDTHQVNSTFERLLINRHETALVLITYQVSLQTQSNPVTEYAYLHYQNHKIY